MPHNDISKVEKLRISFLRRITDMRNSNVIASIFASEETLELFRDDPEGFLTMLDVDTSSLNLKALKVVINDLSKRVPTIDTHGIDIMKESCSSETRANAGSHTGFNQDVGTQSKESTHYGCKTDWSHGKIDFDEVMEEWVTKADLLPLITPAVLKRIRA